MAKKITWEEMKQKYPEEWLLVVDYSVDSSGHLRSGIVERHSKNKKDIYSPPLLNKPAAFRYTGESTFSGLRNHDRH